MGHARIVDDFHQKHSNLRCTPDIYGNNPKYVVLCTSAPPPPHLLPPPRSPLFPPSPPSPQPLPCNPRITKETSQPVESQSTCLIISMTPQPLPSAAPTSRTQNKTAPSKEHTKFCVKQRNLCKKTHYGVRAAASHFKNIHEQPSMKPIHLRKVTKASKKIAKNRSQGIKTAPKKPEKT